MSNRLRRSGITVVGLGFAILGLIGCSKKQGAGTDTLAATNTAPKVGDTTAGVVPPSTASSTASSTQR